MSVAILLPSDVECRDSFSPMFVLIHFIPLLSSSYLTHFFPSVYPPGEWRQGRERRWKSREERKRKVPGISGKVNDWGETSRHELQPGQESYLPGTDQWRNLSERERERESGARQLPPWLPPEVRQEVPEDQETTRGAAACA